MGSGAAISAATRAGAGTGSAPTGALAGGFRGLRGARGFGAVGAGGAIPAGSADGSDGDAGGGWVGVVAVRESVSALTADAEIVDSFIRVTL